VRPQCLYLSPFGAERVPFAELFTLPLVIDNLVVKPSSDAFLATEFRGAHRMPSNNTYFVDLSASATNPSVTVRELPFSIRQLAWYPSPDPKGVHLAVVTRLGDVYLAGDSPNHIAKLGSAARLPETGDKDVGLLDEIFGPRETTDQPDAAMEAPARTTEQVKDLPSVLDMPTHLFPPMQLLWRDVIGPARVKAEGGGGNKQAADGGDVGAEAVETEDEMDEDEMPGVVDPVDGLADVPGVVDIFKDLISTSDI
jgi:hypothetical protein